MSEATCVCILSTGPYREVLREPHGAVRWCFSCRKRRAFDYVVSESIALREWFDEGKTIPDDDEKAQAAWLERSPTAAYYGPNRKVECSVCHTEDGDCFPGTYRVFEE